MRKPQGMSHGRRWLAPWKDSAGRAAIYHCVTRVVDRRLAFGAVEKEQLRVFMRMQEGFSGCRVLAYCFMCSHVHLLVEVPAAAPGGLEDGELLRRLAAVCGGAEVAAVAAELGEARRRVRDGSGPERLVERIHERYTYRMHDLGAFMQTLLQRFTRWYNKRHDRSGTLWESRYRSVLVEDGVAARTVAAYIDLNPVRAGMVADPAAYRWSGYGEAVGAGGRGGGRKARAGLVRAWTANEGGAAADGDASRWPGEVSAAYRRMLVEKGVEKRAGHVDRDGRLQVRVVRKGMKPETAARGLDHPPGDTGPGMPAAAALRHRVRYFTDGAVIGSRSFVDEVFRSCRGRFGPRRRDGARKLRGSGAALAGMLWTARDLRTGVS